MASDPADILDDDLLLDDQLGDDLSDQPGQPDQPGRGEDDEPDRVRDDEDEAARRRRKQIISAWKNVTNARTLFKQKQALGEISQYKAECSYRSALETLLIAAEPVFVRLDDPRWDDEHIASFTIPAPQDEGRNYVEDPTATEIHFEGLEDLLRLPDSITVARDYYTQHYRNLQTEEHTYQVPFGVLDDLLRTTGRALAECGFGIEPEEDTDEWDI